MSYDPQKHHRRSIRLKGYDYAQAGGYFITICTQDRACFFGGIAEGRMHLNEAGRLVAAEWAKLPQRFPGIETDAYVVMPNHFHAIIRIVGAQFIAPQNPTPWNAMGANNLGAMIQGAMNRGAMNRGAMNRAPTLGEMVRVFKAVAARNIRQMMLPEFAWQRNYYEHIIRDDDSLEKIRRYIADNPARWAYDRENPLARAPDPEVD